MVPIRLFSLPWTDVERRFLHAPDSHLLATEPPEFSLED
jgi:hypothetical protein